MSNHNPPTNGFDKRKQDINRKGNKMADFAMFRQAAIDIANEQVDAKINGKSVKIPIYKAILRSWATSKDARLQMAFISYAFGKVPDEVNLGGKLDLTTPEIKGVDYRTVAAKLAPGSVQDSDAPSEDQNSRDGSQVG